NSPQSVHGECIYLISYGETHFDVSILLAVLQNSVLGKNFQKKQLDYQWVTNCCFGFFEVLQHPQNPQPLVGTHLGVSLQAGRCEWHAE
ncbi:MAG: hypothetical protein ACI3YF_04405, partial [Prevotella sp.]